MPTTSGGLRYPASTDAVNVPGDMQKLAEDVDTNKAPKASPTFSGTVTTSLTSGYVKSSALGVLSVSTAVAQADVTSLTSDLAAKANVANPAFTGAASFPDGSAAAPSITNTGDTNTGILFPDADTVAISTGGTERLRVNSNGYVGVGATSPEHHLEVASPNAFEPRFGIRNTNTDTSPGYLLFDKDPSDNAMATGDGIGTVRWRAPNTGGSQVDSVEIRATADAANDATVTPGRFAIFTAPAGGSITERLQINSNGLITGTGTSLGAWTTWTPTLGGTGWALGNATVNATYARVGKIVIFQITIIFGSTSTYAAAQPTLTLPLANAGTIFSQFNVGYFDASLGNRYQGGMQANSTTVVALNKLGTDGLMGAVSDTVPFTWTTSDRIYVSGVYETSA